MPFPSWSQHVCFLMLDYNSSFLSPFYQSAKPSCVKTPTYLPPVQPGPRLFSQAEDQSHPTPPCPTFPTGAKMAPGGVHHLSLPLLLPVTALLLSLLLTGSLALCKYTERPRCSRWPLGFNPDIWCMEMLQRAGLWKVKKCCRTVLSFHWAASATFP